MAKLESLPDLRKTDVGGIMDIIFMHPEEMDDVNPATIIFSVCSLDAEIEI